MRSLQCAALAAAFLAACGGDAESVVGSTDATTNASSGAGGASSAVGASSTASSGSGGAISGATGGSSAGSGGSAGAPSFPPVFGDAQTVSDPANASFAPSVAAHTGQSLIAWHEFTSGQSRVVYALVKNGVPGAKQVVPETFASGKNAWVAPTASGYVVAYEANDGQTDVVRAIEIDESGAVSSGPDTISAPGSYAAMPRVAARNGEQAFSWTDGSTHSFAMRGSSETVGPTKVGTTLISQGLINFPRIALDDAGKLFLSYRDGGTDSTDWEVLLLVRPPGGSFGSAADVSKSPGLLSDDISLAIEDDGTLDVAFVDQDPANVNAFEVAHAARSPGGALSAPTFYGKQGLWSWAPSVVAGSIAAWNAGAGGSGPIYFAAPGLAPMQILAGEQATRVSLAVGPDSVYHLAYYTGGPTSQVRYAHGY